MNRKRVYRHPAQNTRRYLCQCLRRQAPWIFLLSVIASLDICIARNLEQSHGLQAEKTDLADGGEAFLTLRAFELPEDMEGGIYNEISGQEAQAAAGQVLAGIFCQDGSKKTLERWCIREQEAEPERYQDFLEITGRLLADAVYFPIPEAANHGGATVSYENSWQSERTYGGARGHEGCDIMASIQQRGYYPVVSASSGTIEKMGWLPQGGYRVGIRSPHGVYYYYAHLAEYEEGIQEGAKVEAGQLIGYMGDTGYSEVEGTTGNFPVHLHFGMYLDDADGNEVSYNPYSILKLLENRKLRYIYE